MIGENGSRRHFLHVQQAADLARDLLFDIVALVEHERDAAVLAEAPAPDHLEQYPNSWKGSAEPTIRSSA